MDRKNNIKPGNQSKLFQELTDLHRNLDQSFLNQFSRSLPFADTLLDRWERAKTLGFGENSNIYDSSLVLGHPKVGKNCWIGPFTILDGSGGLEIGDYCTISSGVHIYSHDNVLQTLSSGKSPIERAPVVLHNNVYVGPNVVISKGIHIGEFSVIGAFSFVKHSIPSHSIAVGQPAKVIGKVEIDSQGEIFFRYFK
jgi:acetyltransferase-like isoleucine patch superfamily enzyme